MKRGNYKSVYLGIAGLTVALVTPGASFAQKHQAPPPPASHAEVSHPQPNPVPPRGHAGDWLRRYADLPPDEQESALQNDPEFRRLPADRQQRLRERLQHFSTLSPQQQLRVLNRMETWEHLTPAQKQEARQLFGQLRALPPDRKQVVTTAIEDLRGMTPEQREQVINSDRYKGMFSDPERDLMRDAARLPLSPPGGEGGSQE